MELQGLRPVIYPVRDLAAATAWWTDRLGQPPYVEQPSYVVPEMAGGELGLLADADPADGALTCWGVDDVAAAVADLLTAGAREHTPGCEVGDGIVTASVRTPDGSVVGLTRPHSCA